MYLGVNMRLTCFLLLKSAVAALVIGTTAAFAGAEPASSTPIVPPPPPPPGATAGAAITPAQIQAAQALVQSFTSNPPATIPVALQARAVSVLQTVLEAPALLAQLGLSEAEAVFLIEQISTTPTF